MQSAAPTTELTTTSPFAHVGRIVLLFTGCDAVDEVLLVHVAPDAFQWRFTGSPSVPASDLFTCLEEAWGFAWKSWPRQIQIAENWPLSAP